MINLNRYGKRSNLTDDHEHEHVFECYTFHGNHEVIRYRCPCGDRLTHPTSNNQDQTI
jgi:hypothetical protein